MAWSAGSSPATLWIFVASSASSRVSGGQMPGMRLASIDFPLPRRADHQHVVAARDGDLQRALHMLLALHSRRSRHRPRRTRRGSRWGRSPPARSPRCRRENPPPRADAARGRTSRPATTAAFRAPLAAGRISPRILCLRAASAMASAPFTGRTSPVSARWPARPSPAARRR